MQQSPGFAHITASPSSAAPTRVAAASQVTASPTSATFELSRSTSISSNSSSTFSSVVSSPVQSQPRTQQQQPQPQPQPPPQFSRLPSLLPPAARLNTLELVPSPILGPSPGGSHHHPSRSSLHATAAFNNAQAHIAASATTPTYSVLAPPPTPATLASLEGPLLSEDVQNQVYGGYTVQRTLGIGAFSRVVLASPPDQAEPPPSLLTTIESLSRAFNQHANHREPVQDPDCSNTTTTASAQLLQPAITLNPPSSLASSENSGSSNNFLHTSGLPDNTSPPPDPRRLQIETQPIVQSQTAFRRRQEHRLLVLSASSSVVALKMLEREPCRNNQRMKVSWVREVEVLKHISHPSLIHLLRSFCTPTYNILVLECVPGGELFDLVAQSHLDVIAPREWLVRRIVGELASAIGWMHRVNLVHRDIKLENIILTKDLRTRTPLDPASLPLYAPAASASSSAYPEPLVKLTDFGLSRFIDPDTPHLETRCGSEEYAAPELIMGRRYDGRQTDAWALGVVVYALLTGSLPFLEDLPGSGTMNSGGMEASGSGRSSGQISAPLRETSANANGTRTVESASAPGSGAEAVVRDPRARKAHLLRIAKGDLRWPSPRNELCQDDFGREDTESMQDSASAAAGLGIQGQKTRNRLITPQAQAFVSRLLKRDPTKRATVWQVWDEEWLLTGSFGSAQSNTTESAPGAVDVGQRLSRTQLVAESSALDGNLLELPVDPRSEQGREWLDAYTMLRTEPLSAVARDD